MTQPETVEETTIKFDVETTTETTETQSDVIKRVEALEKLQEEIIAFGIKLQKQVDDQLDGRQQVNKAYGEMFANLQKQITLLQSRK